MSSAQTRHLVCWQQPVLNSSQLQAWAALLGVADSELRPPLPSWEWHLSPSITHTHHNPAPLDQAPSSTTLPVLSSLGSVMSFVPMQQRNNHPSTPWSQFVSSVPTKTGITKAFKVCELKAAGKKKKVLFAHSVFFLTNVSVTDHLPNNSSQLIYGPDRIFLSKSMKILFIFFFQLRYVFSVCRP